MIYFLFIKLIFIVAVVYFETAPNKTSILSISKSHNQMINSPPHPSTMGKENGQHINSLNSGKTKDRTEKATELFYLIQKQGKCCRSFTFSLLVSHFLVSRVMPASDLVQKWRVYASISREQTASTFHKAWKLDKSSKNYANKLFDFQGDGRIIMRLQILIATRTCLNFFKKWA